MKSPTLLAVGVLLVSALAYAQAPTRIGQNAVVFIEESEFGQALSAAFIKKKVPLLVTTNREKATFFVQETSKLDREGTAERVTKVLVLGNFAGSGKTYEASVTLTNVDGVVLFAHNAKKGDIRGAAEDVAKKLNDHIKKQK